MTTEERLENLERELTRAKRRSRRLLAVVGLAVGIFALAWIVAGAASRAQAQGSGVPNIIRAGGFVLVDKNDKIRASLLWMGKSIGPALWLSDENGRARAGLCVGKDGPMLTLRDEKGKDRAVLSAFNGEPCLGLYDKNGEVRAALAMDEAGPRLDLLDEKHKVRASLAADERGPGLRFCDENGGVRVYLAMSKDAAGLWLYDKKRQDRAALFTLTSGPGLVLRDGNGKGRAAMGTGIATLPDGRRITYPESSLRLFGRDGKMLWRAP